MNQEPKLSTELQIELGTVFARGYCDEMKGCPMTDDDVIDVETASEIRAAALACLHTEEDSILANYIENPSKIYDQIYHLGRASYRTAAIAWMRRN